MKKKRILFLGPLIAFCLLVSFPGYGQEGGTDVYVIKKGDTLWDLSAEHLRNPYQWPELWQRNQYITNPHLIYPGNALRLRGTPGYARPEIEGEAGKKGGAITETQPITEAAQTRAMEEVTEGAAVAEERALRGEEGEIVELIREGGVERIILDEESLGQIVDARYEKKLLAQGDMVYLAMSERPADVGERFLIFRTKKPLKNPYTKKKVKKVYVLGALKVMAVKGAFYQAVITDSLDAVLRGDEIMTYKTIQ
jgi:LysM repeat protein